jgi:hypothetical protein
LTNETALSHIFIEKHGISIQLKYTALQSADFVVIMVGKGGGV